jgi:hypothetical protein
MASKMTRHFVIASKLACKPECCKLAADVARPLLAIQVMPAILEAGWRKKNPFLTMNYMGSLMMVDTEQIFQEFDAADRAAVACCGECPNLILRSNDGETAENPDEQKWV